MSASTGEGTVCERVFVFLCFARNGLVSVSTVRVYVWLYGWVCVRILAEMWFGARGLLTFALVLKAINTYDSVRGDLKERSPWSCSCEILHETAIVESGFLLCFAE